MKDLSVFPTTIKPNIELDSAFSYDYATNNSEKALIKALAILGVYEVVKILKEYVEDGKRFFTLQWKDGDVTDEEEKDCTYCQELIEEFRASQKEIVDLSTDESSSEEDDDEDYYNKGDDDDEEYLPSPYIRRKIRRTR